MITSTSIIKKLLILFLVFAGLYYAKDFLIPLAIGGVLATVLLPFCNRLEKKMIPRGLAAFFCLLIALLFIAAIIMLLSWQISELTNDVALIKQKAITSIQSIQEYIFTHLGISAERQWNLLKDQQSSIPGILQMVAGSLTDTFTSSILMLVYLFLLLYYRHHIKHFILKLSPSKNDVVKQVVFRTAHVSQQYLLGLAKMIVCLWIMYGISFSIIGIKNPLFYAFLCGLLEIVPFIGNLTGSVMTLAVAAVHGAGLPVLGGIAATYVIVQFIQGWILESVIVGPQVKINPLFTIIALVLGQLVWGIPGVILAIPLTAMFKIVCDHIQPLEPYGFLIGELQIQKKESRLTKKIKSWFKNNDKIKYY